MLTDEHRVGQILYVKNQGAGVDALVLLVQFISEEQVLVVLGQPALMGIRIVVLCYAHGDDDTRVHGVHDARVLCFAPTCHLGSPKRPMQPVECLHVVFDCLIV